MKNIIIMVFLILSFSTVTYAVMPGGTVPSSSIASPIQFNEYWQVKQLVAPNFYQFCFSVPNGDVPPVMTNSTGTKIATGTARVGNYVYMMEGAKKSNATSVLICGPINLAYIIQLITP